MARYSERNRQPVDEVVARWRGECLIDDGSPLRALLASRGRNRDGGALLRFTAPVSITRARQLRVCRSERKRAGRRAVPASDAAIGPPSRSKASN